MEYSNHDKVRDTGAGGGPLPSLPEISDHIRKQLTAKGRLGLLSVSILQQRHAGQTESWQAYDAILDEISAFLAAFTRVRLRSTDTLFSPSVSGNSFVVLLDAPRSDRNLEIMDVSRVRLRLRRNIREHLAAALPKESTEIFGCYVGGALMVHEDGIDVERLLYRSLEEAFADALREREREERKQLFHLRKVLETEQVHSIYQPVVDIRHRRTIGFEALTRFSEESFSNPETVFKIAQQHNSLWSLERLCRRKALDGLPALGPQQLLFLNIEPDSIHDPELLDTRFTQMLQEAGLSPRQIVLEMTEHSAINDFAAVRRTLGAFRSLGFRLAMDDVGSGYSGLQAIAEIAPDYIKVDMSLVRDLHNHPIKRELISTIRKFSDATGISLVAEGVESPEELESLIDVGVRCAQGYLFARPSENPVNPDWRLIPGSR